MAAEKESNWIPLAVVMGVITLALTMTLKARETEHWKRSSTSLEENATALEGATRYKNDLTD